MAIKAHYKGKDGEFLEGIPARDLSEEEYADLGPEQKHDVRYGTLYRVVDKDDKAEAREAPARSAPAEGEKGGA